MQSVDTDAGFVYNENDLRVQKAVNGVRANYTLCGKNEVCAMDVRLLSKIGVTIVVAAAIIRGLRDIRHYMKVEIPQQLIQLVRQAHYEEKFQTKWDIEVSEQMRNALCAPLTPQQVQTLCLMKDDICFRSVRCSLLSYEHKGLELSGVVNVSIDIRSHSGQNTYYIPKAKVRVTVRNTGDINRIDNNINGKWYVSSVEVL